MSDPRAELIETQLADHDGLGLDSEDAVLDRIDELIEKHGREWAGRIPDLADAYWYQLGLVSGVGMTGEAFLARASELVRLAPIVELHLRAPLDLEALCARPELAQIAVLWISAGAWFGDREAEIFAACPYLQGLCAGGILEGNIGEEGYARLAGWMNLKRTTYLDLTGNPCASMDVRGGRAARIGQSFYIVGDLGFDSLHQARQEIMMSYDPGGAPAWPPSTRKLVYREE